MNQERRRRRCISLCLCFLGDFPKGTDLFVFVNQSLDLGCTQVLGLLLLLLSTFVSIKQQDLVNSSCISYKHPQLHEISDFLESHAVKKNIIIIKQLVVDFFEMHSFEAPVYQLVHMKNSPLFESMGIGTSSGAILSSHFE